MNIIPPKLQKKSHKKSSRRKEYSENDYIQKALEALSIGRREYLVVLDQLKTFGKKKKNPSSLKKDPSHTKKEDY